MPPCVRMRPSSTVMLPGPTCFQPARSLPLKSGFQAGVCGRAEAMKKRTVKANRAVRVGGFRIAMIPPEKGQARMPVLLLETQSVKIVVADLDVVEGGLGLVVFDEIVFDAGFFGVRKKILPVNGALADVGHAATESNGLAHRSLVSAGSRGVLDPVFYMDERETAGIFFEISKRILAGDADPAEIQFHGDELGIGFGEEEIVREFAIERQGGIKLERVIVIAELDAGFLAGFAGFIEEFGGALPAAGFGALFFVNPGTNDVGLDDDLCGFEGLRPLFLDYVVAHMAGGGGQAVLVEERADVFRGMVKIAGEVDFLVADSGDFRDGAFKVGLHGVANGVKLQADAVNGVCGVRSPSRLGGGCESCCDGSADKSSSIHARHFTPSWKEKAPGIVEEKRRAVR